MINPDVKFRKATIDDIKLITAIERDIKNVSKLIQWDDHKHINNINDPDFYYLLLFTKNNFEDFAILKGINSECRTIEIVRVAVKNEGNGYGKILIRKILKYVFEQINSNRVWLDVYADNISAFNFYKKNGFIYESTIQNELTKSLHIMSITKNEYNITHYKNE